MLLLRIGVWVGNSEELDKTGGDVMLISAFNCRGGPSLDGKERRKSSEDPFVAMSAPLCLGLSDTTAIGATGMGGEERDGAGTSIACRVASSTFSVRCPG
jgi:hypothetical protein